ncbi:3-keto-disaccharide hydrolase [Dyadobacter sp. 22481]|uniref:3-keto-disaccharide hydrolase n=1 Tax=Dyadobacter sp. 22481 TaxID=3453926 RepID=UPI003F82598F
MKRLMHGFCSAVLLSIALGISAHAQDGWISLFNGKDFTGWKIGANASSFSIEDGTIKVAGPRAHLFYEWPVKNHMFKNFEFKAQVKTTPGSNSGIFIHTTYQEDGWPALGYEVQVNQSHTDYKRTGSLYNVIDVKDTYVKDNEWYTEYVKVEGKHITIKINDKVVVDYEETGVDKREGEMKNRFLKQGTFALQAHDPKSVVYYKDIQVRPLTE